MNWLALFAALVCAVVALVYAVPMLAVGVILRLLRRKTGIRPPLTMLAFLRLPWTPVLLWGGGALILAYMAFNG